MSRQGGCDTILVFLRIQFKFHSYYSKEIKEFMLKIWGRANSVNVQKAVWAAVETGVVFERVDAGMAFGKNNDDWYLLVESEW